MSIFKNVGEKLAQWWHDNMLPWVESLLSSVSHEELAMALPYATAAAAKMAAALATNAANPSAMLDNMWDIATDTISAMEKDSVKVAATSVLTAVNTAIVAHAAAVPLGGTAPPADPEPAPAAAPAVDKTGDQQSDAQE